jgi:lipoprotein-releasing system ATP-binding protein
MASHPPLLELKGVAKNYPTGAPDGPISVLRSIDLALAAGDSVAITGPSGSGKSTLLNLIGTLDRPDTGHVRLEGRDLGALDDRALAEVRSRDLGWIFQAHHLLPQCSALENVLVPTLATGDRTSRREAADRARQLLERVGLGGRFHHLPGQLSGGERQRVAVARALIQRPKLVLADEPTGALDRATAAALGDLLVSLNSEHGVALVVVTHALDLARRMQRRYELNLGRLEPLP